MTMNVLGYAAPSATEALAPYRFERRHPRADDVVIDILYCGVCHSDLHYARNDWGRTTYPLVPGHEIIGRVINVGPDVTRFKPGDHVGVGCMVDSCRHCAACMDWNSTARKFRHIPMAALIAMITRLLSAVTPTRSS